MIAIKNMTMPENCFSCPCLNIAACRCRAVVGASKEIEPMDLFKKPEWCPLADLPDTPRNPEDAYREDFGKETNNE